MRITEKNNNLYNNSSITNREKKQVQQVQQQQQQQQLPIISWQSEKSGNKICWKLSAKRPDKMMPLYLQRAGLPRALVSDDCDPRQPQVHPVSGDLVDVLDLLDQHRDLGGDRVPSPGGASIHGAAAAVQVGVRGGG